MPKGVEKRIRGVCFTVNNYGDEDVARLREFLPKCRYGIFQRERGGNNGVPHLQGFAYANDGKTFARWKECLGVRAHIREQGVREDGSRMAKSTPAHAAAYCRKEETREPGTQPEEFGQLPQQGKRTDVEDVARAILYEGATPQEIAFRYPGTALKLYRGIEHLHGVRQGPREWKTVVYWLYGTTGTGKSTWAHHNFPGAYWKAPETKWWDGYYGQPVTVVDDYRPDFCKFATLLRLLDRFDCTVERKGSSCHFRSKVLIITTPQSPKATWQSRSEENLRQLFRRIDYVGHFHEDGSIEWTYRDDGTPNCCPGSAGFVYVPFIEAYDNPPPDPNAERADGSGQARALDEEGGGGAGSFVEDDEGDEEGTQGASSLWSDDRSEFVEQREFEQRGRGREEEERFFQQQPRRQRLRIDTSGVDMSKRCVNADMDEFWL
nr:rep protein [Cressdnaviricota sp.]